MQRQSASVTVAKAVLPKGRRDRPLKKVWRKIRKPLAQSRFVKGAIATLISGGLRFVRATSPLAPGSSDAVRANAELSPVIIAMWHGQHLMAPTVYPRGARLVAMVSRSADAELNALVVEKFGVRAVRGSGGRENARHLDKGGAEALRALKKALDDGTNVFMIADIPHGTPREAGLGIVTLARLSGRPILPVAVATSRRKILEKTWDKTTINLPFGRTGVVIGDPLHVASDATGMEIEERRRAVTDALNDATARAYKLADGSK